MDALGQFGPISVPTNKEVTGTFTVTRYKHLVDNCDPDDQYSYTDCLRTYVARETNCSVDWLGHFEEKPTCNTQGLVKMRRMLNEIKTSSTRNIIKQTGCMPKCTILHYKFEPQDSADSDWRKEWISSFYLSARTTAYSNSEDHYSYDEQV